MKQTTIAKSMVLVSPPYFLKIIFFKQLLFIYLFVFIFSVHRIA
jgi:hypothetical protein